MRTPYIAGNWKMHKTAAEASALAAALAEKLAAERRKKVMVAPPFTALWATRQALSGSAILMGAQNMGPEEKGAHTGEVSVQMLQEAGVQVVILGHSERRHVYGEPDELINRKVRLALDRGLQVILCVGELLEERERGTTTEVVERQLRAGLKGVEVRQLGALTVAYEPVWAIGTGKTATPDDAEAVHTFIRKLLAGMYTTQAAEELVIQYGGSVKPDNAAELMARGNVDGLLVGGASLQAESFLPIVGYDRG